MKTAVVLLLMIVGAAAAQPCADFSGLCSVAGGSCDVDFVSRACPWTCGLCGEPEAAAEGPAEERAAGLCEDSSLLLCLTAGATCSFAYVAENCPVACGTCNEPAPEPDGTAGASDERGFYGLGCSA